MDPLFEIMWDSYDDQVKKNPLHVHQGWVVGVYYLKWFISLTRTSGDQQHESSSFRDTLIQSFCHHNTAFVATISLVFYKTSFFHSPYFFSYSDCNCFQLNVSFLCGCVLFWILALFKHPRSSTWLKRVTLQSRRWQRAFAFLFIQSWPLTFSPAGIVPHIWIPKLRKIYFCWCVMPTPTNDWSD